MEKKLDSNYTRMLRAILNKYLKQQPTQKQLYGYLPPIMKTIQVRRTRHVGLCWRSRDELISDALLWTPSHGRAKAERPARNFIQQLCSDTGSSLEDLPEAIDEIKGWREKVRNICADGVKWWWYLSKVKLAIVVEGNQKAPFSIATTLGCRGGRYSFPRTPPLYPWYVLYIAKC